MKETKLVNGVSTNTGGGKEQDHFSHILSGLRAIEIRHGDIIDGIRCKYGNEWTDWCGSGTTGGQDLLELSDGEYLTKIYGKAGMWFGATHIVTLNIETNKGKKKTWGSAAHSSGTKDFDLDLKNGYVLALCLKSNYHTWLGGIDYISEIGAYFIDNGMQFIASIYNDYMSGKEKYKGIILKTYRDNTVHSLVARLSAYCKNPDAVINDSIVWYNQQIVQGLSEEDCFVLKLAMLNFYNNYYADKPIKECLTSSGLLAVGQRLWSYNPPIAGDYIFPNIRFVNLNVAEFTAYNDSHKTVLDSPIYSLLNTSKNTFRVGSSSLNHVTPVFEGTRKLQNSNYGLISHEVSDYPYNGTITLEKTYKSIEEALDWAIDNKIEIWLLPELCVDSKVRERLKDLLKAKKQSLKDLKLIVPGSTYVKYNDVWNNQAPIWILDKNKDVVELAGYDKNIPFSMNRPAVGAGSPDVKKIAEAAATAGCSILVEDLNQGVSFRIVRTEVGYIGIAVCRDVLDLSEECNPLNRYCNFVDIMLVVSMNSGHTNCFTSTAESMARWHNCATIYNNNLTSVLDESNNTVEMSFAIWPKMSSAAGIQGEIYYRKQPILSQIITVANDIDADLLSDVCNAAVSSIYSKGVVAKQLPDDGNVYYDIK